MTIVPVMWTVWSVLVLALLAEKIYNGRLTRDEDDHLVLDAAFDRASAEQAALMAKVHRFEPFRKATLWLVVAATLFVAGYYLTDVVNQFK